MREIGLFKYECWRSVCMKEMEVRDSYIPKKIEPRPDETRLETGVSEGVSRD